MRDIENIKKLIRAVLKELTANDADIGLNVMANDKLIKECGKQYGEIAAGISPMPSTEFEYPDSLKGIDVPAMIKEQLKALVLTDQELGNLILSRGAAYREMDAHARYLEYKCVDLEDDIKRLQRKLKTGNLTQTPTGEGG